MPKEVSPEIRGLILKAVAKGSLDTEEIASTFGVSGRFVRALVKRYQETGEIAARPRGHRPSQLTPILERRLRRFLDRQPDATLLQIRQQLKLTMHLSTIHRWVAAVRQTATSQDNQVT